MIDRHNAMIQTAIEPEHFINRATATHRPNIQSVHRSLKTTNFYEFAEVEISIVASAAVRLQSDSLTTVGKQLLSSN